MDRWAARRAVEGELPAHVSELRFARLLRFLRHRERFVEVDAHRVVVWCFRLHLSVDGTCGERE